MRTQKDKSEVTIVLYKVECWCVSELSYREIEGTSAKSHMIKSRAITCLSPFAPRNVYKYSYSATSPALITTNLQRLPLYRHSRTRSIRLLEHLQHIPSLGQMAANNPTPFTPWSIASVDCPSCVLSTSMVKLAIGFKFYTSKKTKETSQWLIAYNPAGGRTRIEMIDYKTCDRHVFGMPIETTKTWEDWARSFHEA